MFRRGGERVGDNFGSTGKLASPLKLTSSFFNEVKLSIDAGMEPWKHRLRSSVVVVVGS